MEPECINKESAQARTWDALQSCPFSKSAYQSFLRFFISPKEVEGNACQALGVAGCQGHSGKWHPVTADPELHSKFNSFVVVCEQILTGLVLTSAQEKRFISFTTQPCFDGFLIWPYMSRKADLLSYRNCKSPVFFSFSWESKQWGWFSLHWQQRI